MVDLVEDPLEILAGVIGYAPPLQVADAPGEVYRSWPADLDVTAEALDSFAVVLDARGTFLRHPDRDGLAEALEEREEDGQTDGERALASAARAAAYLGNVRRKAVEKVTVKVRPATRGRATGWSMTCPAHGPMPVLLPSRQAGIDAGLEHLELDHDGVGTVDAIDRTAGTKKPKRKKRR